MINKGKRYFDSPQLPSISRLLTTPGKFTVLFPQSILNQDLISPPRNFPLRQFSLKSEFSVTSSRDGSRLKNEKKKKKQNGKGAKVLLAMALEKPCY